MVFSNCSVAHRCRNFAAKRRAVTFLDQCLCAHQLNAADHHEMMATVSQALGLPLSSEKRSVDEDEESNEDASAMEIEQSGKKRSSSRVSAAAKDSKSKYSDDHNEICEVCEKGGDLLCCDTCTLVFHLKCIRPRISAVQKG